MRNTLKILLVTVVVAGGCGWVAAKYRFEEKHRIAAEAAETNRRELAGYFAGIVRASDEVTVIQEPVDDSHNARKYTSQAWLTRVADVLAKGIYEPEFTGITLMVIVPYEKSYRFSRHDAQSFDLTILGPRGLRFSGCEKSGDYAVDVGTVKSLQALLSEKNL